MDSRPLTPPYVPFGIRRSVTCVQCIIAGNSESLQVFKPRFDAFPLFPDIASDVTLNPAIGLLHKFFHICNGIIVQPTCCVLTQFLQHLFQTASLISAG